MDKLLNSKILVVCLIALNIFSIVSLYSSLHQGGEFTGRDILSKQILWIIIFWLVVIIFSFINYRIYYDLSFFIYGLGIVLLIAVKFFGK